MLFLLRCVAFHLVGLLLLFGGGLQCVRADEKPTVKNIASGTHFFAITVQGVVRSYIIHVPPSYDSAKKWPVVVMFHGGGGTAQAAMWETGWDDKSDKEGFLSVFPEGTPPDVSRPGRFRDNPQTWNDGSKRPNVSATSRGVHDVDFVSAMLTDLKLRYNVRFPDPLLKPNGTSAWRSDQFVYQSVAVFWMTEVYFIQLLQ